MPKAARRTAGTRGAVSATKAFEKRKAYKAPAPGPRAFKTRSPSQMVDVHGDDTLDRTGTLAKLEVPEREWTDPIWLVQKDGDKGATGVGEDEDLNDDFSDRVGRVFKIVQKDWPSDTPGRATKEECRAALTASGGHCGRVSSQAIYP